MDGSRYDVSVALPADFREHPPWHVERGLALYHGDALDVLRTFRDESVQCSMTSPPYYGLRDYGTGTWHGGDPACDHDANAPRDQLQVPPGTDKQASNKGANDLVRYHRCVCGAEREDRQVGLEQTPEEYVARLTEVFRELRRVLRDDGVLWLNVADSYNSIGGTVGGGKNLEDRKRTLRGRVDGLKHKDLILVGPMLASSLQSDGWYLRAQNIWHKPNAMPSSAKDRPGLDYEYVYQLTKSPRYYFDMDAVKQTAAWERWGRQTVPKHRGSKSAAGHFQERSKEEVQEMGGKERNLRTVWSIPTKPYKGAHFAAFPPELVETCVAASSREGDVVLDPFVGSGTTAFQCARMGRRCVGIDLKEDYLGMTVQRFGESRP